MEEIDKDITRKRQLFGYIARFIIVIFSVLAVVDYMEDEIAEILVDVIVVLLTIGGWVALRGDSRDLIVYRVIFLLFSIFQFFSVIIGAGEQTVLFWIFLMPLMFYYFFNKSEGGIWSICFAVGVIAILLFPSTFSASYYDGVVVSRFIITFLFITAIAFGLESSRYDASQQLNERNLSLQHEKQKLEEAIQEIKTLSGMIPICASCKKIRNDDGFWERVESYIEQHSSAQFSHGICGDCANQLYGQLDK